MGTRADPAPGDDIREARRLFPATDAVSYFDTAALGLASRSVAAAYHKFIDEWTEHGPEYLRGEKAGDTARDGVARIIGAEARDVALIASVSAAAGLVAAQLGPAGSGHNVVIGEREYSSNHYPWRLLAAKGYEVRQVAFRNGGLEPDDVARHVDAGTVLIAFSGVQSATGHRSDIRAISAIARAVGAIVFVDGSQLVGALPVAEDLAGIDVLTTSDHKFLMNAGRGLGYCYLAPEVQDRFTPINAGWKAGRIPFESYYGPAMDLSPTASRFDSSISWLAAIGDEAALSIFDEFGIDAVYARNRVLAELLRTSLSEVGWAPIPLPAANRSCIVAVPLVDREPAHVVAELRQRRIVCSVRDGNLRVSVHLYNHEDDIQQLTDALSDL
jgi:cysteine desulfurase/selenocysteine lyase